MSRFLIHETPLAGLTAIERHAVQDARGALSRLFCAEALAATGWTKPVAQINHTQTRHKGSVRGLHFQKPPHAEMKLVSCIQGEVWDVAVDLRQGSPSFLRWHALRLSAENRLALLIPEGFAHGFQALTDDVALLYCHSAPYTPDAEAGLHPQDPALSIEWPLPITTLSARDAGHPWLSADFAGLVL
jgi:dTDP-4-dehydrorhamnose 3,5-epimerase